MYGKAKICVILWRNFALDISESPPGFLGSISVLRCKKKLRFNEYAKPSKFKKYDKMTMENEAFCWD